MRVHITVCEERNGAARQMQYIYKSYDIQHLTKNGTEVASKIILGLYPYYVKNPKELAETG